MITNVFSGLLLVLSLMAIAFFVMSARKAEGRAKKEPAKKTEMPSLTLLQLLIRLIYRASFWLTDVGTGLDRGYLSYRMERASRQFSPFNEQWREPARFHVESEVAQ